MGKLKTIDGYLSTRAQRVYPDAIVYKTTNSESGEAWTLERKDQEIIGLGDSFHAAQMAINALLRANKNV